MRTSIELFLLYSNMLGKVPRITIPLLCLDKFENFILTIVSISYSFGHFVYVFARRSAVPHPTVTIKVISHADAALNIYKPLGKINEEVLKRGILEINFTRILAGSRIKLNRRRRDHEKTAKTVGLRYRK